MERRIVGRGVVAGAMAGLLAFVFARIFASPVIRAALNYESGRDAAQAALDKAAGLPAPATSPDLFSRSVQANIGTGVGVIAFSAAMGALLAVAFCFCVGRVGLVRPRTVSMLLAGGGFVGIYLVPFIKYPANPPAIGHEDTIRTRGALYLAIVLASVVLLICAVSLGRRLRGRFGVWNSVLLAASGYVVAVGCVMAVLPMLGHLHSNVIEYGQHATETPMPLKNTSGQIVYPGFPANVLFNFRLYSVATQLLLWTTLGLIFAVLSERVLARAEHPGPRREHEPIVH